MQPTVNLFIASGGKHDEKAAQRIYLYTLYKNTKRNLNITWLSPETMGEGWNRTTGVHHLLVIDMRYLI